MIKRAPSFASSDNDSRGFSPTPTASSRSICSSISADGGTVRLTAYHEPLVVASEHVDAEAPRAAHARPGEQVREGQKATSGGWSEMEVSELTISPEGSPSGAAVTKATPVANLPTASRKLRGSGAGVGWALAGSAISVE
jgi:hypothetical protein